MKQVDVSNYEETVRLMSSPHENKQEKDLKKQQNRLINEKLHKYRES